jgi:hypothetical protein
VADLKAALGIADEQLPEPPPATYTLEHAADEVFLSTAEMEEYSPSPSCRLTRAFDPHPSLPTDPGVSRRT